MSTIAQPVSTRSSAINNNPRNTSLLFAVQNNTVLLCESKWFAATLQEEYARCCWSTRQRWKLQKKTHESEHDMSRYDITAFIDTGISNISGSGWEHEAYGSQHKTMK